MDTKQFYRLNEAAKLFDVSYQTIWRWCNDGKLASVTLPSGQRRIPAWEIEYQLEKLSQPKQG
jgi:excisionase family DNA binding protein